MSITKLFKKSNISLPANPGAGEVVSFDLDGRIERFPLYRKLFLAMTVILVAVLSFGIGRLTVVGNREPVRIEYDPLLQTNDTQHATKTDQAASFVNAESVVASKNGSKYHYSYCPGAKQIKEENKIVFSTTEAAEASGYSLAANCKSR
jgi:hypothetical protein